MSPPRPPTKNLTRRIDLLAEDEQILLALRVPHDLDWLGEALIYEGESIEPYRTFFSTLVSPLAEDPKRTWVMAFFEPSARVRKSIGLPVRPGDIDIVAGTLTADGRIDLDAPLLGVEVGVARLRPGTSEDCGLGDDRKDDQAEQLSRWPFEFVAVVGIIPEQTSDLDLPSSWHKPTISPNSLAPELDRFVPPLGLLSYTHTASPGSDPSRTGIGLGAAWLRPPVRRSAECFTTWRPLRYELQRVLELGVAFQWEGLDAQLVLPCGEPGCGRYVMFSQSVPLFETSLPLCDAHADRASELGATGVGLLRGNGTPIPTSWTGEGSGLQSHERLP